MEHMTMKRAITHADILPMEEFGRIRKAKRAELLPTKRLRRIEIGPVATAYFESYDTMWLQVHEMLYIEKGGVEQIDDELGAYNPLIPQGDELVATVMFEIDDPVRRASFLGRLGGVEETMFLRFGAHEVMGQPEEDVDRTSAAGKASSVQFIHFPFTAEQKKAFAAAGTQVIIGFKHPQYAHMAVMQDESRQTLARDFS
jgi:hypothetical protein